MGTEGVGSRVRGVKKEGVWNAPKVNRRALCVPLAGALFAVEVEVPGVPEPRYRG